MQLFDLHADTAYELYRRKASLSDGPTHITLKKAAALDRYAQIAAVWSDRRLDDEAAWEAFQSITDYFDAQVAENETAARVATRDALTAAVEAGRRTFVYGVEDARLLGGKPERVPILYRRGVRILTLQWQGETCIGGSHDTELPLTPFGREVVRECFACGITPDVSHASRAVTDEVLRMAREYKKPAIASHSGAYAVYAHSRNLTDAEFIRIRDLGGIVGVTFYPRHLTDGVCTTEDILSHVRHFLALGGEDTLALGGDFDGIEITPQGLPDLAAIPRLQNAMHLGGIPARVIDKIFFDNAYGFAVSQFP